MRRNALVVIASRANYGRIKSVMKAISEHPQLNLQVVLGASALLSRFGSLEDVLHRDGFNYDRAIHYVVEGETPATQAKSTGLGIIELATAFSDLKPDMVITVADRFETMATAVSASYLNIPLVHVQGGERSGNIDNRVRDSITKLADVHFPATSAAAQRLVDMGEAEEFIFECGCPSIDLAHRIDPSKTEESLAKYRGAGTPIDWKSPYLLMLQHPVTTSYGSGYDQTMQTLEALQEFPDLQKVVMWPNIDAGSDDVSKAIRHYRETHPNEEMFLMKNFAPEDYLLALHGASCAVGNSSSFIREGSFLGVPAVVIGDRQRDREHGSNVAPAPYSSAAIAQAIRAQLQHGRYEPDDLFGAGDAGALIADVLAEVDLVKARSVK